MTDKADFTVRLIDKVKGPASSAEKALGRLEVKTRSVQRASSSATKATGRFTGAAKALSRSSERAAGFGGALDVFKGNLLTAAAGKVLGLAAVAGSMAAEFITVGQNSKLAFDQLAKHGASGTDLLEHADSLAKRLGLDLFDTRKQYTKLLALQFTPKGIDRLIKMGADLRILGADAEGVQGVLTTIGQIKGKGKLQAEELMQLAERGVSQGVVGEEIGKILGKSKDEVAKLMAAGKVDSVTGIQAIENAINRKLVQSKVGESGARFADKTLDGMLGRFKAYWQSTGLKAFEKTIEPLTKMLGAGLEKFVSFIESPKGAATVERIAHALGDAALFARDFSLSFGKSFGEGFEKKVAPLLGGIEAFAGGDAKALGEKIAGVAVEISAAAVSTGKLVGQLSRLIGPLAKLVGLLEPVIGVGIDVQTESMGALTGIVPNVDKALDDKSGSWFDKAWNVGRSIAIGLDKGLNAPQSLVYRSATKLAEGSIATLKETFDSHSPSRVTMAIGADVGRGLALGTERQGPRAAAAGADLAGNTLGGVSGGFGPGSFASVGPQMASLSMPSMEGGGGARSIVVNLQQDINGSGLDAEEVGRISARESRRELESFFRQLAMEG